MTRVLIVAAYASVRAELHALLAGVGECAVVGAASGSAELERRLPALQPQVVLLDDGGPDTPRSLELLRALPVAWYPSPRRAARTLRALAGAGASPRPKL